jgi:hypothetical protein
MREASTTFAKTFAKSGFARTGFANSGFTKSGLANSGSAKAGRIALRACVAALIAAAACTLGGCASSGGTSGAYAMAAGNDAPTVAFESVDGPPPQVFDRMVSVLDSESKLRNLQVVSRQGQGAAYRVRSYLSAEVVHGKTMIAWVWDVYDRDQQRALRLSGEEPAGKAGRDAWAAADDMVLRKIAQAGLTGLANMISGAPQDTAPAAPSSAPEKRGPAVASGETPTSGAYTVSALSYTDH